MTDQFGSLFIGDIRDMDADPANPNRFYAAFEGMGNGFFMSTTGGMSWNPINKNIPAAVINNSDFAQMAVRNSPGNNAVYAVTFDNQGMGTFVLNSFRSTDQGTTWTPMDQPPMIGIPRRTAIAADPNDPNVVYIASVVGQNTANCNRPSARTSRGDASQAAGSQWLQVICDNAAGTSPHPDALDLVFDNTNSEILTTRNNLQVIGAGPAGMENDLFGIETALEISTTQVVTEGFRQSTF